MQQYDRICSCIHIAFVWNGIWIWNRKLIWISQLLHTNNSSFFNRTHNGDKIAQIFCVLFVLKVSLNRYLAIIMIRLSLSRRNIVIILYAWKVEWCGMTMNFGWVDDIEELIAVFWVFNNYLLRMTELARSLIAKVIEEFCCYKTIIIYIMALGMISLWE